MPLPLHTSNSIANALDAIGRHFKNPKITLVVRNPDIEDADLVLTNDDPALAIKAIEHTVKTGDEAKV